MSVPKTATIKRYCDNYLAVAILRERGIISEMEFDGLLARCAAKEAEAYAKIYDKDEEQWP